MSALSTVSSTMSFTRSAVIVCEREPYWTPELQRQLSSAGIAVRGCQRMDDLVPLSRSFSLSVHIADLENLAADCLENLRRRQRETSSPPLILIAGPQVIELEWVLREAGAAAVFSVPVTGQDVARCCRKWLSR